MFGALKTKIGNRVFWYTNNNGCTEYYNSKGNRVLKFSSLKHNLCSMNILQDVHIYNVKDAKLLLAKQFSNKYSRTTVTFQNITKVDALNLLKVGFIDTVRLPGSYTGRGGMVAKESNCLGMFIYNNPKKPLRDAQTKTLALISKFMNS